MIETGEWNNTYYAWKELDYGMVTATKSTVSEEDARAKLEAGNGKCIFVGYPEPTREEYFVKKGIMDHGDFLRLRPVYIKDLVMNTIDIRMEEEQ